MTVIIAHIYFYLYIFCICTLSISYACNMCLYIYAHLHSFHMLARSCSKSSKLGTYINQKLPDVQPGYRKGRGTRDQIVNIYWVIEKAREFQKNIYFNFIDYAKAFDCVDHNKLWKNLKEMGIPDQLNCLLRNLYAGQEATVITRHRTIDWFQIGKGVSRGCILSPCLLDSYTEYIMQNTELNEAQA